MGDLKKSVWTTIISGDLDKNDKVFESIVEAFKANFEDADAGYRYHNNDNAAYGTHARLLLVAVMMTQGDILELGMGEHSTKLIHDIITEDNKTENRMLVSAESDSDWLGSLNELYSPFHQILYVEKCRKMESTKSRL